METIRIGGLWDGETKHQAGAIWDSSGLAPTIDTMTGGGREPHIMEIWNVRNIYINSREGRRAWSVKKRCSTSYRNRGGIAHTLTCRDGSTNVQHCNLIIEVEKLEDIKQLGKLEESSSQRRIVYDDEKLSPTLQAAMGVGGGNVPLVKEVEKLGNVGDIVTQGRSVFNDEAISPTLIAGMSHGNTVPYIADNKKLEAVIGSMQENAMVGNGDYSPSLTSAMGMGGGQIPMIVESEKEQNIVAMRGRNPENPSDRSKGAELEQRLEINTSGCTNTLTTVQKDNLILEEKVVAIDEQNNCIREETFGTLTTEGSSPKHNNRVGEIKKIKIRQATKQGFIECEVGGVCCLEYPTSTLRRARTIENGQISPTLTTESIPNVIEFGNEQFFNFLYEIDGEIYLIRIRKLIPKECWRLMGFTDEDFDKAEKVNSNTQLYKQAGNSIVVNCLEAIFSQLNIQGIPTWNEQH